MTQRQTAFVSLEKTYTLQPGAVETHGLGDVAIVQCLESDGSLVVTLDGVSKITLQKGLGVEAPTAEGFRNIQLENKTGQPVTQTLFLGHGKVNDNRLSQAGGAQPVKTNPGESVAVENGPSGILTTKSVPTNHMNVDFSGDIAPDNFETVMVATNGSKIIVQNEGPGHVYLHTSAASGKAGEGLRLDAGGVFDEYLNNNFKVCNPTGAADNARVNIIRLRTQ